MDTDLPSLNAPEPYRTQLAMLLLEMIQLAARFKETAAVQGLEVGLMTDMTRRSSIGHLRGMAASYADVSAVYADMSTNAAALADLQEQLIALGYE